MFFSVIAFYIIHHPVIYNTSIISNIKSISCCLIKHTSHRITFKRWIQKKKKKPSDTIKKNNNKTPHQYGLSLQPYKTLLSISATTRWAFNSSSEVVDIPVSRTWVVGKGLSQVSYTPHSHQEYGSLLCWARNDVGKQKQPCIYHVIHAGELFCLKF